MKKWLTEHDDETITFHTASGMFHLYPPCTYSMQEEFGEKEAMENENYQALLDEKVDGVLRRDLPEDHAEYCKEGYFDLNGRKYLQNVLAKAWVDAFVEVCKERDKSIRFDIKYTGTTSPPEYNFRTDAVRFDLTVSLADLERIHYQVFDYRGIFREYLREYHSSGSGLWSWMPNSIEKWERCYGQGPSVYGILNDESYSRAVICLLEFWLFAFPTHQNDPCEPPSLKLFEENVEEFRDAFDYSTERYVCNGAEQDCYDFHPKGSKDYEWYEEYVLSHHEEPAPQLS